MPRKVELDIIAPGDPDEVMRRIKEHTRWSLQPYRGGPFTFSDKPFKGRVEDDSMTVGLNRRDWWSLLQPTARATFEPAATGTRIRGEVSVPDWMTWMLRFMVVVMVPLAAGVGAWAALSDGQPVIAAVFALFAVLVTVFSLGWNLSHANEQVDALKAEVLKVAGTSALGSVLSQASEAEVAEAMREAEAAGQPERTREGG